MDVNPLEIAVSKVFIAAASKPKRIPAVVPKRAAFSAGGRRQPKSTIAVTSTAATTTAAIQTVVGTVVRPAAGLLTPRNTPSATTTAVAPIHSRLPTRWFVIQMP